MKRLIPRSLLLSANLLAITILKSSLAQIIDPKHPTIALNNANSANSAFEKILVNTGEANININ
jgi:hypothetical protein